jgi:predicted transglutaminase-like cysteine proteinase
MIKRNAFLLTFAASCLSASLAFAECSAPSAPSKIPDGATASEPEMLAAMQTLKKYNEDVTVYTKCLQFEEKQNRISSGEAKKAHNAAVEKLESVASKFNEQVQVFKAKKG